MKFFSKRDTGILLSYVNTFLNMFCGIFLSSFLIRMLGDSDYGVYQTISSFATYLVMLEFGTGTVMTRNIATCRGKEEGSLEINKHISTIWTVTHILSVSIVAVAVAFYFCIDIVYSATMTAEQLDYAKQIFVLVILNLIISFYLQTINGVLFGFEKYTFISFKNLAKTILRTGLLVVAIIFYREAIVIAAVDLLISFGLLAFTVVYCKKSLFVKFGFFNFEKTIFKSALPLCLAIFLQTIINQANNNVDKTVIGIMLSPEAVTLYSIALYIFSIFSSLTTIPISMYAPQVSKDMSRGISREELSKRLVSPCRLTAIIGGTVLFGFVAVGRQFVEIAYGAKYLEAWLLAIIIMAPAFINMINGVLVNVLNQLNKRIFRSLFLIITTVGNIILTIVWIGNWGMMGAAIATAICTLVGQVILMNIYYAKAIKIKVMYMFRKALSGILPFQLLGAVLGLMAGYFIQNVWLSFLVGGVIFVVIFSGGYLFFGANEAERAKINSILHRRKQK